MSNACAHSDFMPSRRERDRGSLRVPVPGAAPQSATKGKKNRKLRADVFDMPANTSKAQELFDLWALWQRGLRAEGYVARRDLMAGTGLRTVIYAADEALEPGIAASKARIGAQEQQMIRAQATGAVASWISNRQNDFRDAITRAFTPGRWGGAAKRRFRALPDERRTAIESDLAQLRHELNAINTQKLWMAPAGVAVMRKLADKSLVPVSSRARRLARTIFQGIAFRHRWPRFERLTMRMDDRAGFGLDGEKHWLEPADPGGLFTWWLHIKTKTMTSPVLLPIRGWGRDREDITGGSRGAGLFRPGALGKSVNIFLGDDSRLKVALTRDLTEVFEASRDSYTPLTDVLALDFGLNSLFASNHGDLVGRNFRKKIEPLAHRADREAARMQAAGRKPRDSKLYQSLVVRLRAMIDTEINRALNHLVALHRPRVLAVESLDFRGMNIGRRINRILSNCGRGAVARKLADLNERYGIEIHEVEAAYTSQTCSCCGYVDARQRKGEKFQCCFCGTRIHADVNGARNIAASVSGAMAGQPTDHETATGDGRSALPGASSPDGKRRRKRGASSSPRARSFILKDLVHRFDESMMDVAAVSRPRRGKSGHREMAPDPRLTNPYWKRHSLLLKRTSDGPRNHEAAAFAVTT
ncbi:RNA-guided endonuclease InsQ/TnpB family protein [Loktanella sp. DJP18]|uniref:RNA-guided endonuclease InsQ/TnpB family protein n=1 Tax=Loktanella sp. DJP18 TaxID=3409788 RepID=UPI003BB7EB18